MASELKGADKLVRRLRAVDDPHALLARLQLDTVAEAKRLTVPFRKTGNLGRSIVPGSFIGPKAALVVARASYAAYVEIGTGLYGPRHRKIVPKNAKVLAFPKPGTTTLAGRSRAGSGSPMVFARSVRGRRPTPYLLPGARIAIRKNGLSDKVVSLWNGAA